KLELGQKLIGQHRAGLTEIDRAEFGDRASAAAERRPAAAPVLLNPHRQQQRDMIVADQVRAAGQENAREYADIESEAILMQEAIFGGELDVAEADIHAAAGRQVKALGQGCGQLKIRRRAIIEVDSAGAG